jgi:hypothetical protein
MKTITDFINENLLVEGLNENFFADLINAIENETDRFTKSDTIKFCEQESFEKDMIEDFNKVRYEASPTGTGMRISLTEKDSMKNFHDGLYSDGRDYTDIISYEYYDDSPHNVRWNQVGNLEISLPEFTKYPKVIQDNLNKTNYNKFLKQLEKMGAKKQKSKFGRHIFLYKQ